MKKMSTLFIVNFDANDNRTIIPEIRAENTWVPQFGIPTQKLDGTACAIINGILYKRYDAKKGKTPPTNSIPCQPEPDPITGHFPHWTNITKNDIYHIEAFAKLKDKIDGTYELCGPKINGNHEKLTEHILIKHGSIILPLSDFSFNEIKQFLYTHDIEGIVFHHSQDKTKFCKIRKTDFGFIR